MNRPKRRDRTKSCHRCQVLASVLYRVRYDASAQWQFICPRCLPEIKHNNALYTYGGTWKAYKAR